MKTRVLTFLTIIFFFGLFASCAEEEIRPDNPTLQTTGVDGMGDVETGGF